MRFALLIGVLAGCYNPTPGQGAPCGPNGECPSGLVCLVGKCLLPGTPVDGPALDDTMIDSASVVVDAMPDAPPLGPWGAPNEINAAVGGETDPSITQNKLMMMIMSEDDDDLYVGARANVGNDFTFVATAALNTSSVEKSPDISPDGTTLYFVSNRDGDFDVYRSTFNGVFSPPTLVAELSSPSEDSDVAISPDGLTAIVERNDATNAFYLHTRTSTALPFGAGVHHPELSITADVAAPTLTNGAAVVYFHAGGTRDIFVAYRMTNGNFTTPAPVTELNTGSREAAPFVHQDNRYMVFERSSDIYETSR